MLACDLILMSEIIIPYQTVKEYQFDMEFMI